MRREIKNAAKTNSAIRDESAKFLGVLHTTHHTQERTSSCCNLSEGVAAQTRSSQTIGDGDGTAGAGAAVAAATTDQTSTPANRLGGREATNELAKNMTSHNATPSANPPIRASKLKGFGRVGGRGSYTVKFKLRAVEFTKARQTDWQNWSSKSSLAGWKRIFIGVQDEEKNGLYLKDQPKGKSIKSLNPGYAPSKGDIEQRLVDYIDGQRKGHRDCGSNEVMNKLLEFKPDALGALETTANPDEIVKLQVRFR